MTAALDDRADERLLDGEAEAKRSWSLREHLVGSVLLARIASGGLWLLVAAAVVMAALALVVRPARPDPAPVATAGLASGSGDAVLVAGFAQMAVRRYVGEAGEDAEDVAAPLVGGDAPDLRGVTPAGFYVVDAVTVGVEERGDGYWAATVAADLMAAVDERYEPIGVRHYSVGVVLDADAGGAVLADLPSQVPAPQAPPSPKLLAGSLATPDDGPQIAAAREFLGALLLGEGSIQRYTAPGTDVPAIQPPPFAALQIDGAAIAEPDADRTPVRVSLLAVDANGLAQRLTYTLDLRVRDGRWEVVELFDAPPLAGEPGIPTGASRTGDG